MPDYDKSDSNHVVLRIPGTVINENYSVIVVFPAPVEPTKAIFCPGFA